ncbi:uncharacterized protein LOC126750216 isoform X2 [Anthonomus grandis grandis]|uniref:uncharacterized protein LOC126750216 isoform X2 n=1 Tax=Anthonomus grandis grandis TaxID=2921223 RepID=UPI002165B010|nr:uncharacterized protein LOC126750216 isoform X2 [Anthonomus grandis grandis]
MDSEPWSPNYQQSVRASLERNSRNKSDPNAENEPHNSKIKEDPDAKTIFPQIKNEFMPSSFVISEKSRQTIRHILEQIKTLSQNDKYLLYLKLPSEITDIIDPFRQTLNPLGSRSEIHKTIVWIQTHLEEDQNISLPKKEVYNEYEQFCEKNEIKALSQADFGKVMKQVFPKVRARRLGQRGNSKYCYSGLRRRVSLKAPCLPDIFDKPLSTECPVSQTSLTYAAWLIVKDWANQQLGIQFTSLQSLAHYLVRHCAVASGSDAASKLTSNVDSQPKTEEGVKNISKHGETKLQLQKKIQQRTEGKERKRKIQNIKPDVPKPGLKKSRSYSVPAASTMTTSNVSQDSGIVGGSGECSTASSTCSSNSVSPTQGRNICDKPEFTQLTAALPDFKSFQKPNVLQQQQQPPPSESTAVAAVVGATTTALPVNLQENPPILTAVSVVAPSVAVTLSKSINKIPISRSQHVSPVKNPVLKTPPQLLHQQRKAKYKTIQARLQQQQPTCDIGTYNNGPAQSIALVAPPRSQIVQDSNVNDNNSIPNLNECDDDDDDFPLTRERLDSVSNVEKDAMDEYLGTNNSQHEEELSKYFSPSGEPQITTEMDHSSKLSTLRQLLEQSGIPEERPTILDSNLTAFTEPTTNFPPYLPPLPPLSVLSSSTKRRVSFETPIAEEIPQSPNTRSKNFNFTPISPGPQSPIQSKCSSTSASPFVSPRNTPVPRKNSIKPVKVKTEMDLSLDISPEAFLPMSAPVSPMLSKSGNSMLQKLLNANSKVQYTPEYAVAPDSTQFFPDLSRSQSVPLQSKGEPELIIGCDNNNIDAFNLDMSTNNQTLTEYGLNLVNTCAEGTFTTNSQKLRNITRSHSIDIDVVGFDIAKSCNPSRSVPSTPLPFTSNLVLDNAKNFQNSSRSYPSTPLNNTETFVYQMNSDCLLNGQPIRGAEEQTDVLDPFLPSFELNNESGQLDDDAHFPKASVDAIVQSEPFEVNEPKQPLLKVAETQTSVKLSADKPRKVLLKETVKTLEKTITTHTCKRSLETEIIAE